MKGIILAGGTGTRLYPLTAIINKHLLPVGKFPMIHYAIEKLKEVQIEDIMIITGMQSIDRYAEYLGSGRKRGVRITYQVQDEAGGIAQALSLADRFILPQEKFVVLLGDNLFESSLVPFVKAFLQQERGAKVLVKEVRNPSRYGVPTIENNRIVHIEEKPKNPKSPYCVTGIYMYDSEVFHAIERITPSARGELEITDVNNDYAARQQLSFDILPGWWVDAGTFASLQAASQRMLNTMNRGMTSH